MGIQDMIDRIHRNRQRAEQAEAVKHIAEIVGIAVLAAAAGVAAGILLAPASGCETRQRMLDFCRRFVPARPCAPDECGCTLEGDCCCESKPE